MNIRQSIARCTIAMWLIIPFGPIATAKTMHAVFNKGPKKLSFSIRNETGVAFEFRIGNEKDRLEVGKTMILKLPAGTKIVTETETKRHHIGELLIEVSDTYSDSTLVIQDCLHCA